VYYSYPEPTAAPLSFISMVVAVLADSAVSVIPPFDTCSPTFRGSGVGDGGGVSVST
jgi:hypothetical protein